MATLSIAEATEADFARDVLEVEGPVLVEFYATWCGSCRRMAPVLDRLAADLAAEARFVKVNADEAPALVAQYGVTSTPTIVVFDHGVPGQALVGAQPEQAVRNLVTGRAEPNQAASETDPAERQLELSWVPTDACRLPSAEQPERLAAFEDLFATALRSVERVDANRLRLGLSPDPAVAAKAAELAVRESDCCGFFSFNLTAAEGALALEVSVPDNRIPVLDGLTAQAQTAGAPA